MADGVASRFNQVTYDAQDERHLDSLTMHPSGSLGARGGVRPTAAPVVSIGGSPESWTVAAHSGVVEGPADADGSYLYAIQAVVSEQLPARPAAGQSRKDILVVRVLDADVPATGSALREVDVQHLAGASTAGTPTAPATPTGSLLLATLTVPATGAITVATGRRTAALGGVLPVANAAERDALPFVWDGLMIYRDDLDTYEARANGAWTSFLTAGDDSGVLTIAPAAGWTQTGSPLQVRRIGDVVILVGGLDRTGAALTNAGQWYRVGTVPAGLRPANTLQVPAYYGSDLHVVFRVASGGDVEVLFRGTSLSGAVYFNATWWL